MIPLTAAMADPIDPSIIVRGASSGTYSIDEPVEVLELTSTFFTGHDGEFYVDATTAPLGNSFRLVFKNATDQAITQLTIRFAFDDFFGAGGYDPNALLAFGFTFESGSPFTSGTAASDGPGGFVTWTFFGNLPPVVAPSSLAKSPTVQMVVAPSYDPGYFELEFNDFPEGMQGILSVPEPGSLLFLIFGLSITGYLSRRRKAA